MPKRKGCISVAVSMPRLRADEVADHAEKLGVPISRLYQKGIALVMGWTDVESTNSRPRNRRAKNA